MQTIKKLSYIVGLSLFTLTLCLGATFALPQAANAQVAGYYPYSSSSCITLTYSLSYGNHDYSTGNQVSELQTFLIARGYLNAVATGYFGSATYAAVINFQRAYGIDPTGNVGPITRAEINSLSCNGTGTGVVTPIVTQPIGYGYNYPPIISSVQSPTYLSAGQQGTWTVIASNPYNTYNTYNNQLTYSVNWGDQYNYGYNSAVACPYGYICSSNAGTINNGQSSTFTHVYSQSGTYTIIFTVTNAAGQSARTTTTVQVGGNSSCVYNGSYSYNNCGNYYTNGQPSINTISPTQANIGTQVTIYGSGFTATNNSVLFGSGAINNIPSYDGRTLTFTIPSYVGPYCQYGYACAQYSTQIQNGTYGLSVENINGTSNQITFTIGYGGYGYNNGINISSVSPASGPVNTQVTLYGTGFTSNETVHFGSSIIQNVYSNGSSLTFYIPSQQSCTYVSSGSYGTNCSTYYQPTTNGIYQIYVTDQFGTEQSNSITYNVTGTGTNGTSNISLSSVTSNAPVGSVVTVYGTGFDYSGDSVYINGAEVASNVYSYGNGYIQFTLPQYAGSMYLSPGSTYQLTVENQSGYTSNAVSFTVGY